MSDYKEELKEFRNPESKEVIQFLQESGLGFKVFGRLQKADEVIIDSSHPMHSLASKSAVIYDIHDFFLGHIKASVSNKGQKIRFFRAPSQNIPPRFEFSCWQSKRIIEHLEANHFLSRKTPCANEDGSFAISAKCAAKLGDA